ncbi:MAG: zinc-binding dehydrogenase [Dehalococcoidia bacterium]|nr:zinc-binding dehydrogenase [Dehalococcoidia bacterium]MDW8119602.1 zinc-binding dehydrogenase [Chloroflexota bacterium]
MPTIGRAAVFEKAGKPFTIVQLPVPEVEPGGILIKVTAAGICGSDLHYWRGDNPVPITVGEPGPVIPGHEFMGVVHTLGKNIKTDSLGRPLKEGDRVVFPYFFPCQRCYWCARGELHACPNRVIRPSIKTYPYCNGGFAEYFYLRPGHWVFKAPEGLSEEALTPVNCALSQVLFGLHQARPRFGDTVVVQGAGGLGLYAMAVARDMGAEKVIAIDGQAPRLQMAERCGATHTINITEVTRPEDRIARVRELTDGRGADVVVEVVGFPQVVPEGIAMLRRGGTYVEIGHISPNSNATLDMSYLVSRQIRILGIMHYDPWVIPAALDFLVRTRDRYPLTQVVSHKFPLERINEAFQEAEWKGREGGSPVVRAIVTP